MSSGGKWSDDAVGRGILVQREKEVSLFLFSRSFIHVCDCESLRCDAERESVCVFPSSPFFFYLFSNGRF